ncbi:hypothetical protein ACFL5E_04025 [Candidatus Omnitrophota bacterium]
MNLFKTLITAAAVIVFLICTYSFLLGNEVFGGKFTNDAIAWYMLAKGIFCSLALYLLVCLLETMQQKHS